MKKIRVLWIAAFWLAAHVGMSEAQEAEPGAAVETRSCHLNDRRQEAQCGVYKVFEDRRAGSGRELEIHFAVIPAVDESSEPDPLVFFAGGPGQAATEMARFVRVGFPSMNEKRDIVLIDQRGMGDSSPLKCDVPDDLELATEPEERERLTRELLTDCLDKLQPEADVTLYTQDLANADIHEILKALGYDQVNLYGVSWGTRSAMLYAHQYPDHVRTIILDGSLPLVNTAPLHAAADAERAMLALFDDCAADAQCSGAFPTLREDFDRWIARLGIDGERISLRDPTNGEEIELVVTHDMVGDMLRSILYSAELSRLAPVIIHQAAEGDYRGLIGVSGTITGSASESMTLGATLTIFCSEEFGRMSSEELEQEATARLLGHQMLNNLKSACEIWPNAPVPAIYQEEVAPNAPTLVLSGEVDPITPPQWGERTAEVLPNAVHFVAPATAHNVAPFGCASDLVQQAIDQGNLDGLDGSCLEEITRPSFFVDASGPSNLKGGVKNSEAADESADESGDEPTGADPND